MGNKNTKALKRKTAQVFNHLDNALRDIRDIHSLFDGVHAEHTQALEVTSQMIIQAQELLEAFSWESWRAKRDKLEKYR